MGELSKAVIGQNLLQLVKEKPEVKKNRNMLVTEYWKEFHHATTLEDSYLCPSAESITRRFRSLVSGGSIHLDEESKEVLSAKEEEFRNEYSPIPDYIQSETRYEKVQHEMQLELPLERMLIEIKL